MLQMVILNILLNLFDLFEKSFLIKQSLYENLFSSLVYFFLMIQIYIPFSSKAGNVVTCEMVEELILSGADIVKCGIGPG